MKDKIIEEERVGNTVKMPKKNDEIIAIKQSKTNMIYLWDIRKRKNVRKFNLELAEPNFDTYEALAGEDGNFSDNSSVDEKTKKEFEENGI